MTYYIVSLPDDWVSRHEAANPAEALAQAVAEWNEEHPGRQADVTRAWVLQAEQASPELRREMGFAVPVLPYLEDVVRFNTDLQTFLEFRPTWTAADRNDLFRLQEAWHHVNRRISALLDSTWEQGELAPLKPVGGAS